jgi:UDP-N-acetylmuramoyl-tripeptide--D-alanyl-D-alanine ligase
MWRSAWLLKPDIVVMLGVSMTHPEGFDSLDTVAEEKAKLLGSLSRRGVAILNADDARVAAMAKGRPFEVIRFGRPEAFNVWADEISATWPDRLRFRVHAGDKTQWIQTQFVGAHWVPSVLAAITAALHCGVSIEDAAKALTDVQPFVGRMQPVELPGGTTMIRDEHNGSLVTAWPALQVLKTAKAQRKLVVLACFDGVGASEDAALPVAQEMAGFADIAIVVGSHSEAVCRTALAAGMDPRNLLRAESLPETAEILRQVRRPGDLVLLRGLWDWHMSRVYFAQLGSVACWKTDCERELDCDTCTELGFRPFERALGAVADTGPQATTLRVGRGHSSSG